MSILMAARRAWQYRSTQDPQNRTRQQSQDTDALIVSSKQHAHSYWASFASRSERRDIVEVTVCSARHKGTPVQATSLEPADHIAFRRTRICFSNAPNHDPNI